jgi:hypothetical protein
MKGTLNHTEGGGGHPSRDILPGMRGHHLRWALAWLMAAAAACIMVAASRCQQIVREVRVRTLLLSGDMWVSPGLMTIQVWRTPDYDPLRGGGTWRTAGPLACSTATYTVEDELEWIEANAEASPHAWLPGGFGYTCGCGDLPRRPSYREVFAPTWAVVVALFTPICILTARRALRLRRIYLGACPHCDYDLRATPERCPECGAVPSGTRRPRVTVPPWLPHVLKKRITDCNRDPENAGRPSCG